MLSSRFKRYLVPYLRPPALALRRLGISANHLTLFGLAMSLATGLVFARGRVRLGGFMLMLSGLGDMMDGTLARTTGTSSRFGAFIDSVADRYAEFFVFAGLGAWLWREGDLLHEGALLAALLGSFMVSYTRARAESVIGECTVGLMERPERIILLIVFALAGAVRPALWILAVGANLTAFERILYTWKATRRPDGATASADPGAAPPGRKSGLAFQGESSNSASTTSASSAPPLPPPGA